MLDKYPVSERTEYTDNEFCDALEQYRNQEIQSSIQSANPLVRMFAILDRCVGKRALNRLREEIDSQPLWLQGLYRIRMDAELCLTR